MLSKNKIKYLKGLSSKKNRTQTGAFLVEGRKSVAEVLNSDWKVLGVWGTKRAIESEDLRGFSDRILEVELEDLQKVSGLQNNLEVIAEVQIKPSNANLINWEDWVLCLDGVSDPGNLGTIIRTADWFKIPTIILMPGCVDMYNPKTIQSTMGSFTRVNVLTFEWEDFKLKPQDVPVFSAFLNGMSPQVLTKEKKGVLVMGSESHGISDQINELQHQKITIPNMGSGTESLNVAVATAILCYEIRRSCAEFQG